ncbi:PTS sugar transporter subunit IIB [Oenococcus oeni]|uniref:PTS sugar transporter subunit IIB n=1 Tax=Oenococcus oeni TaxID=1247 RepID=UPI0008F84664|nr:PTS sugar transporter subunit IIB [Oenococcus oeni]OIK71342.1 PTS lactose transporter subunit IIB [Oenococcus oeni]OIK97548.1 PTS lactose transporter subunit IIB [Oenococcus oeni]OIL55186.1 PTS lactose transporter subunit IIB [Oenococcus oeni]OIL56559.1 PTS lactose transporter subunit IIB [Oenococcus oeni]OIM49485.1 PTS lactose transporter subunit IIB [Oenococcus oeni]
MRLAAVCQSGLGTSFMVQMNIQNVLNDEGVDTGNFELSHMDVGSTTPDSADYFFIESTLETALGNLPKEKVVLLKSIIDADETKQKVNEILDKNKINHK